MAAVPGQPHGQPSSLHTSGTGTAFVAVTAAQGPPHQGFYLCWVKCSPCGGNKQCSGDVALSEALHPFYLSAVEFSHSQTSQAGFGPFQSHGLQCSICKPKVQCAEVINPVGQGLPLAPCLPRGTFALPGLCPTGS